MECFKCRHVNQPGAKFCSNCGRHFVSRAQKQADAKAHDELKGQAQKIAGEILDRKSARAGKNRGQGCLMLILGPLVWLGAVGAGAEAFGNAFFWVLVIPGGLMFLANLGSPGLSAAEYYSLPGSKTDEGKHRCILCGHTGLYRHTQYQTDVQLNDCPRCKKRLFTS